MPSQSASSPFFGFARLQIAACSSSGAAALAGHVAQVHPVQHGRVDAA